MDTSWIHLGLLSESKLARCSLRAYRWLTGPMAALWIGISALTIRDLRPALSLEKIP
jgi:hypothetical protein